MPFRHRPRFVESGDAFKQEQRSFLAVLYTLSLMWKVTFQVGVCFRAGSHTPPDGGITLHRDQHSSCPSLVLLPASMRCYSNLRFEFCLNVGDRLRWSHPNAVGHRQLEVCLFVLQVRLEQFITPRTEAFAADTVSTRAAGPRLPPLFPGSKLRSASRPE